MGEELSQDELDRLRRLSDAASAAPWRAMIEGRDHTSGADFIMIGDEGAREEDMYVSRDSTPASRADLDVIAATRTLLTRLLDEVERLRAGRG